MKNLKDTILNEAIKEGGYIFYSIGELTHGDADCLMFKNFNDLIKKEWNDDFVLSDYFNDVDEVKSELEKTDIDNQLKTGDEYCDIRIFKV